MRRKGFTIIEALIATAVMGIVLLAGVSVMKLMTTALYDGQTESRGRISLSDNIYYMTREIQSAQSIQVSADCKTLKIKQRGSSGYSIEYTITDGNPAGSLSFKSKTMLYLDYGQSKFELSENRVKITLAIYKTNLDYQAKPQIITLEALPRSHDVALETNYMNVK